MRCVSIEFFDRTIKNVCVFGSWYNAVSVFRKPCVNPTIAAEVFRGACMWRCNWEGRPWSQEWACRKYWKVVAVRKVKCIWPEAAGLSVPALVCRQEAGRVSLNAGCSCNKKSTGWSVQSFKKRTGITVICHEFFSPDEFTRVRGSYLSCYGRTFMVKKNTSQKEFGGV